MSMTISDSDTGLLRSSVERGKNCQYCALYSEIAESVVFGVVISAPEEDAEEFDEATDTFGHLSVDQNNEVSYRALW